MCLKVLETIFTVVLGTAHYVHKKHAPYKVVFRFWCFVICDRCVRVFSLRHTTRCFLPMISSLFCHLSRGVFVANLISVR